MAGSNRDEGRTPAPGREQSGPPPRAAMPDPGEEDEYWRSNWRSRPYTDRSRDYEHYRPAFRFGWESRGRYGGRRWEEVESELASEWDGHRDRERAVLKWDEARLAARDAWRRLELQSPGEAQRGRP